MEMNMKTQSEILVEMIAPQLVTAKLLLQEDTDKYKEKISLGTMKAEDWLMAIEKALDKEDAK
jgi:short-subunit dehydrogenase